VQHHVQLWDALYRRTFEVLPLTFEAAREGLWREAQRRRPAKVSGKEGSRDSAIWVTVLQEAKRDPKQTIYFVTSNSKDFGPDQVLHPELAAEVTETGVAVAYLGDLKNVLAQFAERRTVAHDDPRLKERIAASATTAWLHQLLVTEVTPDRFEACVVDFDDEAHFLEWADFDHWLSPPVVQILSWSDEAEYVAADVRRLAATVRVLATGVARRLNPWQTDALVAFTVDVRVVFGEGSLSSLSVSGLRPVEDAEESTAAAAAERAHRTFRR
jgi:hypothetical protein